MHLQSQDQLYKLDLPMWEEGEQDPIFRFIGLETPQYQGDFRAIALVSKHEGGEQGEIPDLAL